MDGEYIRERLQVSQPYQYAAAIGIIQAIVDDNINYRTDADKIQQIRLALDAVQAQKEGK